MRLEKINSPVPTVHHKFHTYYLRSEHGPLLGEAANYPSAHIFILWKIWTRLRYLQIITEALNEIRTLHCVQLLLPDAVHLY